MNVAYEYVFTNSFDISIYNNGPVTDPEFLSTLEQQVTIISDILSYNPGIPRFSSFINYNNNDYKITVVRQ